MKLRIREAAFADLESIHAWIAGDSAASAPSVIHRIVGAIENRLALFPVAGRAGAVAGTREWIVHGLPYIIVYRIDDANQVIDVLAIFHAAQAR